MLGAFSWRCLVPQAPTALRACEMRPSYTIFASLLPALALASPSLSGHDASSTGAAREASSSTDGRKGLLPHIRSLLSSSRPSSVILCYAATPSGIISPLSYPSNAPLSCPESKHLSHSLLREIADFIVVGSNTLRLDNPRLLPYGTDNGLRPAVVFGKRSTANMGELWREARLGRKASAVVFCHQGEARDSDASLFGENATIVRYNSDEIAAGEIERSLGGLKEGGGPVVVLVEGGPKTLQKFIDEDCWDVAVVTVTGNWIGGDGGRITWKRTVKGDFWTCGRDVVWVGENNRTKL